MLATESSATPNAPENDGLWNCCFGASEPVPVSSDEIVKTTTVSGWFALLCDPDAAVT